MIQHQKEVIKCVLVRECKVHRKYLESSKTIAKHLLSEMSALEAYYNVDRGNSLSSFPQETGWMGLNDRCDLISSFEKVIQDMNKLGRYDLQMFYMRNMNTYLNASSKHK